MRGDKNGITILADNQAAAGLFSEHGLSMWIRVNGRHILFDTGQGDTFERNAKILGLELNLIQVLVLSHGHFDHTGGIPEAVQQAPSVHVYGHPGVVNPRYNIRDGIPRPIQMPSASKAVLDRLPVEQMHWVQHPVWLSKEIGITGPIPRKTIYEDTGGPFYEDPGGRQPDLIDDDMALWIQTDAGLVVCLGCSHAGIVNTLHHIRHMNGGMKIRAVIGGFHLINADRRRLDRTIEKLCDLQPDIVIPCHCTGKTAVARLVSRLGSRVVPGEVGMTFTL
ncbi:MAG: MBL fold metallo-hydrolase [Desulfobacterales bacterium]